jgi:two-component system chemotaxis sensor kinase CheA
VKKYFKYFSPEALLEEAQEVSSARMLNTQLPPHILVIDDSLTSRVLVQSILEAAGYKIDLAINGRCDGEGAQAPL